MKKIYLLLAVILATGCQNNNNNTLCGNDQLDPGELCDGDAFISLTSLICENGMSPNLAALKCSDACQLDLSEACLPKCGNGIVEPGEDCDGAVPAVTATCKDADLTKLKCEFCKIVDEGVCKDKNAEILSTCGNGVLDDNELCDGLNLRESAKICPPNMALKHADKFRCMSTCRLIDISEACVGVSVLCGNGRLDNGESCDGGIIDPEALTDAECPSGFTVDPSLVTCDNDCSINASNACIPDKYIVLSEVVPALEITGEYASIGGLALEFTNMGTSEIDISQCKINVYKPDGDIVKSYEMSRFGQTILKSREPFVLCSQSTDHFEGKCDAEITEDLIQRNISDAGFMALVCEDQYIDILNLNSFLYAISKEGADFIRLCNEFPVTEPQNALLGEGWSIDIAGSSAPTYGLGEHCSTEGLRVESCTYTVSRETLDYRGQTIEQRLEVRIPGLTTLTDKTDSHPSVNVRFVAGLIEGTNVNQRPIHYVWPTPDMEWTNSEGIDRYVGVLHNYDTYEGFIGMDEGSYTLDAAISFDNKKTWTYCGPRGIIANYEHYNASERNRLDVYYTPSTCGDGIVEGEEVCDGNLFVEESLVCEKEGQIVTNRSKLQCQNCIFMSSLSACTEPLASCGNNQIDGKEICDGDAFLRPAKLCPTGMVPKEDAELVCDAGCSGINQIESCEIACNNGRLDDADLCEGDAFNLENAQDYCAKFDATFAQDRATCSTECTFERAACIPNKRLVVDSYLIKADDQGSPTGIAVILNNYGTDSIDPSLCSMSFLNSDGILMQYVSLSEIVSGGESEGEEENPEIASCVPLKVCAVTAETSLEETFGECSYTEDALLSLWDSIDRIQISCGGDFIDYFDFSGMKAALSDGMVHGALKASDHRPWSSAASVSLTDRMDLNTTFDLSAFGHPVCE